MNQRKARQIRNMVKSMSSFKEMAKQAQKRLYRSFKKEYNDTPRPERTRYFKQYLSVPN